MTYTVTLHRSQAVLKLTYKRGKFAKLEIQKGDFEDIQIYQIGTIIPPTEDKIDAFQKKFGEGISYHKQGISAKIETQKTASLYKNFVKNWFDFYENQHGIKPKFSATDGKVLKEIIKYFTEICQSEEQALASWEILLQNWQKLDAFHQKNTDLKYINSNLNKILQNAKQLTANGSKSAYSHSFKRRIFEALQSS